jgi:hypothetical protein
VSSNPLNRGLCHWGSAAKQPAANFGSKRNRPTMVARVKVTFRKPANRSFLCEFINASVKVVGRQAI